MLLGHLLAKIITLRYMIYRVVARSLKNKVSVFLGDFIGRLLVYILPGACLQA